jgi:ferredoxin
MTDEARRLVVSAERCIGCQACANQCPEGLVDLHDTDHQRTISFAVVCDKDCDLCVKACPTEAITLSPVTGATLEEGTQLSFEKQACASCGAPVVTEKMGAWLQEAIPTEVQTDAEGQEWLALCPRCRREAEAQRVAREAILTRWP